MMLLVKVVCVWCVCLVCVCVCVCVCDRYIFINDVVLDLAEDAGS